jgi:hypothetical protein
MHVIVSMNGEAIAKTQCKSCGGVHMYREPKSSENSKYSTKVHRTRKRGSSNPKAKSLSRPEKDSNRWKDLVEAHGQQTPRSYRMQECFREGELISHSVFGTGVVIGVRTPEKIDVHFEKGIKLLAQGR